MYKTPKERITGVFKGATEKVKDVASDMMTMPIRMKVKKQMKKDMHDFETLKEVNESKGKPDAGNYTDPLFRKRVEAANITYSKTKK